MTPKEPDMRERCENCLKLEKKIGEFKLCLKNANALLAESADEKEEIVGRLQEKLKAVEAENARIKQERDDNEYFHASRTAISLIAACRQENMKQFKQIESLTSQLKIAQDTLEEILMVVQHNKIVGDIGWHWNPTIDFRYVDGWLKALQKISEEGRK